MIRILEEPKRDTYKSLLSLAMEVCDEFILVKREQIEIDESGQNLLTFLKPFLKEIKRQDNWPGTGLLGHYAEVYYFNCSYELVDILTSKTDGLYGWMQPSSLEDICFFKNGIEWLVTVSHEQIGWINTNDKDDFTKLRRINGLEIEQVS